MRNTVLIAVTPAVHSLSGQAPSPAPWQLSLTTLVSPAAAGSAQPQFSVSSRGVLLSWVETAGTTATRRCSERTANGWSPGRTAASGADWFVNWADVPSVGRRADGTLVAHWLQKSGPGRSSGYPRMALHGNELVFAWIDREGGPVVRTAVAQLSGGTR